MDDFAAALDDQLCVPCILCNCQGCDACVSYGKWTPGDAACRCGRSSPAQGKPAPLTDEEFAEALLAALAVEPARALIALRMNGGAR